MKAKSVSRLKASLMVLAGASSYGILSTFVKLAYEAGFTPSEVTGSQVTLGAAALWLFSMPLWKRVRDISVRDHLKLLGSGVFTGLTGVFYYYSLTALDASFAVLLLFQFTWMGLMLGWVLHGAAPNRFQVTAVAIVLAGTLLASGLLGGLPKHISLYGIGLGLLSAACYTLFMYFSGRVAVKVPALLRSTWMITGAALIVAVIYPPQFLWNGALGQGLWIWGGLLGLFGMIIPSYLYAKGAPYLETGLTAILGSVELPVVILCSALLLKEKTGMLEWIGIALILAGVMVSQRKAAPGAQAEA
ncbi:DMT family transporter [Paenibacillus filicis]|uniref:DMT family transporter n=1 Tax=Paenibacillus gyeongsangnamensis TaxID=3388067 RepID=A0ABT4Q2N2_9BACL|nr:DMT family transporter [Paenibacillus filicis]MCZ8511137.1 DMT family transporter [Paenibacillus filicis]